MAKTIIDLSGLGGLAPKYYGDHPYGATDPRPELKILGKENMYASGTVNPLSIVGYLSPANNTFKNVGSLTGGPAAASIADTINFRAYFFTQSTTIHSVDTDFLGVGIDGDNSFPRTITGAEGTDLEIYTVNGSRRLFYSYKATNSTIGIWDFTSGTGGFTDNWLQGSASGGFYLNSHLNHKMIVADDGYMYILDGPDVHKLDGKTTGGTNGTASQDVLVFPANFRLIDGIDLRGKMWILLQRSTRTIYTALTAGQTLFTDLAGVYIWDRKSSVVDFTDFVPIEGVREVRTIFSFRGIPWVFAISNTRYTQLLAWNGSRFELIREMNAAANPRFPDSVQIVNNMITWMGDDGYLYKYGKPDVQLEDGLYQIGQISSISTGGAILAVGGQDTGFTNRPSPESLYLSWNDSSTYRLQKWYPNAFTPDANSQTPHIGDFFSLVKRLPKGSTVKSITFVYPQTTTTSTTTEFTAKIYFNQSVTSWGSPTLTRTDGTRGYKYIQVGEPNVYAVQIEIEYNTGLALGIDRIFPSYAICEYEETNRKL